MRGVWVMLVWLACGRVLAFVPSLPLSRRPSFLSSASPVPPKAASSKIIGTVAIPATTATCVGVGGERYLYDAEALKKLMDRFATLFPAEARFNPSVPLDDPPEEPTPPLSSAPSAPSRSSETVTSPLLSGLSRGTKTASDLRLAEASKSSDVHTDGVLTEHREDCEALAAKGLAATKKDEEALGTFEAFMDLWKNKSLKEWKDFTAGRELAEPTLSNRYCPDVAKAFFISEAKASKKRARDDYTARVLAEHREDYDAFAAKRSAAGKGGEEALETVEAFVVFWKNKRPKEWKDFKVERELTEPTLFHRYVNFTSQSSDVLLSRLDAGLIQPSLYAASFSKLATNSSLSLFDSSMSRFLSRLEEAVPSLDSFGVAMCIETLAKLGAPSHPLVAPLFFAARELAPSFATRDLIRVLEALSKLKKTADSTVGKAGALFFAPADLVFALFESALPRVDCLGPRELSSLLLFMSRLNLEHEPLLKRLCLATSNSVDTFSRSELAITLDALARIGAYGVVADEEGLLAKLCNAFGKVCDSLTQSHQNDVSKVIFALSIVSEQLGESEKALLKTLIEFSATLDPASWSTSSLYKLHVAQTSLDIEQPDLKLTLHPALLRLAEASISSAPLCTTFFRSEFLRDLSNTLTRINMSRKDGVVGGLPVDFLVPSAGDSNKVLAIEIDGPTHYFRDMNGNPKKIDQRYLLKHRLLKKQGIEVLHVPYFKWLAAKGEEEKQKYIERLQKKKDSRHYYESTN